MQRVFVGGDITKTDISRNKTIYEYFSDLDYMIQAAEKNAKKSKQ